MEVVVRDLNALIEVMDDEGIDTIDKIDNAGYLTTSNFGGVVVLINSTGETVFVQDVWGKGKHNELQEIEIEFDEEGDACFTYNDCIYYLDEFMRIKGRI